VKRRLQSLLCGLQSLRIAEDSQLLDTKGEYRGKVHSTTASCSHGLANRLEIGHGGFNLTVSIGLISVCCADNFTWPTLCFA
jgi:hypothetical protein